MMKDRGRGLERKDSKVRFSATVDEAIIGTSAGVTGEDKNSVWYSRDELKTLKKDQKKHRSDETNEYEGSEVPVLADEDKKRKEKRQHFIRAILEQQTEQKKLGINDPKGLRALSRAASKNSRKVAEESAMINQSESLNGISEKLMKRNSRSGLRRSAASTGTLRRNSSFSSFKPQNNARPRRKGNKKQEFITSHRIPSVFDETILSSLEISTGKR